MAETLRAGIIGYGLAGRVFHAPLVAATPGMRVAAIVTADPQRGAQAQADHPAARVLPDAQTLLSRPQNLDLVIVATPNRTHVPLALQAIEARLPVVVDKPFAPTAEEARRVIAAAHEQGVPLTVFQNRRWDSDFLTVRALLEAGRLGDVVRFESRFDRWRPTPKGGWRESGDAQEAGGLLYDLGTHLIDQALQLFGPVREVYAELDRRRPGVAVDDDVFLALHHVNGVRSQLWASALAASRAPRFRLMGLAGTFTKYGLDVQEAQSGAGLRPGDDGWGLEPASDAGILSDGTVEQIVPTLPGRYQDFTAAVRDALLTGGAMPIDPRDAVAALEIIEAARISSAAHQIVELRPGSH